MAMNIDLSGRTAVITGASRGLGEAMAKALSAAGAQIALVARDMQRLDSVRDAITRQGGTAAVFTGDVTREEDVAAVVHAVAQRLRIVLPGEDLARAVEHLPGRRLELEARVLAAQGPLDVAARGHVIGRPGVAGVHQGVMRAAFKDQPIPMERVLDREIALNTLAA